MKVRGYVRYEDTEEFKAMEREKLVRIEGSGEVVNERCELGGKLEGSGTNGSREESDCRIGRSRAVDCVVGEGGLGEGG